MKYELSSSLVDSTLRHIRVMLDSSIVDKSDVRAANARRLLHKELAKLVLYTELQKNNKKK